MIASYTVVMPNPYPPGQTIEERFWSHVQKTPGCWLWTGTRTGRGYGQLVFDKRVRYAHRFSVELARGPIAPGMEVNHLCNNPPCVRPDHLRAVPHRENMARSHPGRFNSLKTHCPHGHEYTEANVYVYRGRRNCRECARIAHRELRARGRVAP